MKHNIAIVDPSGKISDILISIGPELDAVIHGFRSAGNFAEAINHKMYIVDDLTMVIICIVHASADHPGFKAAVSLAGQLKKHSILSVVPVVVIGPGSGELRNTFTGICTGYIALPVKKSELKDALSASLENPLLPADYPDAQTADTGEIHTAYQTGIVDEGSTAGAAASGDSSDLAAETAAAAGSSAVNETAAEAPVKKKKAPARKKSPRKKKSSSAAAKMTEAERLMASVLFTDTSGFTSSELVKQSIKAQACVRSGNLEKADKIISSINVLPGHAESIPFYYRVYLKAVALYNIALFDNEPEVRIKRNLAAEAFKACKAAVKAAEEVKPYYADALCLTGICCWTAGKPKKALKWWGRAVSECENLGSRTDLARTYFEAGSRLLETEFIPESKIVKVMGLTPGECLDKAESIFREMDLQYDLEQLEAFRRNMN